jgi:hypothetical protein
MVEKLYSSKISIEEFINFASQFLIKLLHQVELLLKISPGTANKSFHKSRANLAVIKLPDFSLASTRTIQEDNPATISFLIGKLYEFQGIHIAKIEIIAQLFSTISSYIFLFQVG